MMEKETHVDSVSYGEPTDICQILIDIVEDHSEVCRRDEQAISGLSQSNQWRLGKSKGEPGTPLPATNSDSQNQKVGLGNLSLNSPNIVTVIDNMFQDLNCYSKCVPMDKVGVWSNFLEILEFVKAEIGSSITYAYAYDQRRHQNANFKYFDAAFSNVPDDENILVDQTYNSKREKFDAANCNKPSGSIPSQTNPNIDIRVSILSIKCL